MSAYNEVYWGAAGTATVASFLIMRPWAFYVAAMIGTMVSNPEGMDAAAENWRNAGDSGVNELDQLDTTLKELKTYLKDAGKWEGAAFEAFDKIHGEYQQAVTQLKESREAAGAGVESSATFFKVGAIVCSVVAAAMLTLGVAKRALELTGPVGKAATAIMTSAVGKGIMNVMEKVFSKHLHVIGALGGVLYVANTYAESTGRIFPGLEAMPTAMSSLGSPEPFAGTEMVYDEKTGALTPKFDLGAGGYPKI